MSHLQASELFREYQQAFESITGLPLVLRSPESLRTPLQDSKRANPFCVLMTQTNQSCAACLRLQQRVEEEAAREPATLECYAGLSESAVPVLVGDRVIGFLQTGQVLFETPSRKRYRAFRRLMAPAASGADERATESAYLQTRVVSRKQYASIIRLLLIFAEHLAAVSHQILIRESTTESPSIRKARAFIAEHLGEQLRLRTVAQSANMSAFYFCKMFRESTGLTFTEYLARARVESVKHLLLNVHSRVSEVCYAAGFQSLSQFNRVFGRLAGEAPSRYRERLHGSNGKIPRPATLVRAGG